MIGNACFAQNSNTPEKLLTGEWRCFSIKMENEIIDPGTINIEMIWKFDENNFTQLFVEYGKTEIETGTFQIIAGRLYLNVGHTSLIAVYTIQGNILTAYFEKMEATYIFKKQ